MAAVALENVVDDYINMFKCSWTWGRMTDEERERFLALDFTPVKGTAKQRGKIMSMIYSAFLAGLGYNGCYWREPITEKSS